MQPVGTAGGRPRKFRPMCRGRDSHARYGQQTPRVFLPYQFH